MIQPEDPQQTALAIYREYLRALGSGDGQYFHGACPPKGDPDLMSSPRLTRSDGLREGSKESARYGYSRGVEGGSVAARKEPVPQQGAFATELDLLRVIGKEREFRRF